MFRLTNCNNSLIDQRPSWYYYYTLRDWMPTDQAREFGSAWAIRRDVYFEMGFILDLCIINDCDPTYNWAAFKDPFNDYHHYLIKGSPYYNLLEWWVKGATKPLNKYGGGNIVRGSLVHYHHERVSSPFEGMPECVNAFYDAFRDTYRDENFTLRFKEDSKIRYWMPPYSELKIDPGLS